MRGKALTGKQVDNLWADFMALCNKYGVTPKTMIRICQVRVKEWVNGSA